MIDKNIEVPIETIVSDDSGQEFKATIILTIKEIEKGLKEKGYKIVKV